MTREKSSGFGDATRTLRRGCQLGQRKRLERRVACGAIEDQLAVGGGIREGDRVLLRCPGADKHVVVELDELRRDRPPYIAGPENADLHKGECRFSAR